MTCRCGTCRGSRGSRRRDGVGTCRGRLSIEIVDAGAVAGQRRRRALRALSLTRRASLNSAESSFTSCSAACSRSLGASNADALDVVIVRGGTVMPWRRSAETTRRLSAPTVRAMATRVWPRASSTRNQAGSFSFGYFELCCGPAPGAPRVSGSSVDSRSLDTAERWLRPGRPCASRARPTPNRRAHDGPRSAAGCRSPAGRNERLVESDRPQITVAVEAFHTEEALAWATATVSVVLAAGAALFLRWLRP